MAIVVRVDGTFCHTDERRGRTAAVDDAVRDGTVDAGVLRGMVREAWGMSVKTKSHGGTIVLPCVCEDSYQDGKYGSGRRVFNHAPGSGGKSPTRWRCTKCNQIREYNKENN